MSSLAPSHRRHRLPKGGPWKGLLAVWMVAVLGSSAASAVTIVQWTFETSIPTTAGPLAPESGSGNATSNTNGTFSNPAGWGSAESWSSTGWAVGEFFQFQLSTAGYSGIGLSWQQTGSDTGPAAFKLAYSTDGSSFTDFGNYTVTNDSWNGAVTPAASVKSVDLSGVVSIQNATAVYFRLVTTANLSIANGTIGSTGTSRVDNFTVSGTAVPEPSGVLLALAGGGWIVATRRRRV